MLIESWESLKIEILRGKEMKRNETEEEEERGHAMRNYWQKQKLNLNDGGKILN